MQTLMLDKANRVRLSLQVPGRQLYQPETNRVDLDEEANMSGPTSAAPASPRRPGRPLRPPLTEDVIAQAALDIIDERDWQACTMKALAQRLGVRAPSLYHHIAGQHEIVDLVRQLVVREIHDPSIATLPAAEAMWQFGMAYYRGFAKHPNTIQVLSTTPVRDRDTLQMYELFLQTLVSRGWQNDRAFEALLGLEHLALGFAFEWNAEDLMLDSAAAAAAGAPLVAEVTQNRTNQNQIAEHTFRSLLARYVAMFEIENEDASVTPRLPAQLAPRPESTPA